MLAGSGEPLNGSRGSRCSSTGPARRQTRTVGPSPTAPFPPSRMPATVATMAIPSKKEKMKSSFFMALILLPFSVLLPIGPPGVHLAALDERHVADGVPRLDQRELGEAEDDPRAGGLEHAALPAEGVAVDRDLLSAAQRGSEVHPEVEDPPLARADPARALDPQPQRRIGGLSRHHLEMPQHVEHPPDPHLDERPLQPAGAPPPAAHPPPPP